MAKKNQHPIMTKIPPRGSFYASIFTLIYRCFLWKTAIRFQFSFRIKKHKTSSHDQVNKEMHVPHHVGLLKNFVIPFQ